MKLKKKTALLIFVPLIALFIFWEPLLGWFTRDQLEASGTIETTEIEVGSRVGGRIATVSAQEGQSVQPNAILLTFDPYQLPAQKAQLEAQLAQAQAMLLEMQHGARPQEIAAARAQYLQAQAQSSLVSAGPRLEEINQAIAARKQAQADLDNTTANYNRFQTLLSKKVISQQEFDAAQAAYRVSQEKVDQAAQREKALKMGSRPQEISAAQQQAQAHRAQYQLLAAGTRAEEIAAQKAVIKAIQAQLAQLSTTQSELNVLAPCSCEINSLNVRPGQLLLPNQTIATLINLNDIWVRVYIPEERFGQVKAGDKVAVTVDAFPNKTFTGKVVQLATRAEFTPRNVQTPESRKIQVFGIKVALDNTDRLLRPGMPADVQFHLTPAR